MQQTDAGTVAMRVRYSAGCKRRAASLTQFLRDVAVASRVPVDSFELLVLQRSDWQARLQAPYGLPLVRKREGRVIAAADYPERLVKSLDNVLMDAANRGVDAPSGWRELFDVLIGVRWAQAVMPADLYAGVYWLDVLLAQGLVWQACISHQVLDTTRLAQWWQVCAAGEQHVVAVAPRRAPEVIRLHGHMGLVAMRFIDEGDWSALLEEVRNLARKHGKVASVDAKKKLEHWLEHTSH